MVKLSKSPPTNDEESHPTAGASEQDALAPLDNANAAATSDEENQNSSSSANGIGPLVIGVMLGFFVLMLVYSRFLMILIFVGIFIFLRSNIPPEESFDAKKEMQIIKRGKNLPDGHRDKPKGWFGKKLRNVTTAATTNLANAVNAYHTHFVSFGILTIATVHDVTTGEVYHWAGFMGQWRLELGQTLARFAKTLNTTVQQAQQQAASSASSQGGVTA